MGRYSTSRVAANSFFLPSKVPGSADPREAIPFRRDDDYVGLLEGLCDSKTAVG